MLEGQRDVYRVSASGRAVAVLLALAFIGIGISIARDGFATGGQAADRQFGLALALAAPPTAWAFAFRPRIIVGSHEITVVNQIVRRTVATADVVGVASGQQGLQLTYRTGGRERTVVAWAVQTNRFGASVGGETRSERIEDAIARACPSCPGPRRHRRRPDA